MSTDWIAALEEAFIEAVVFEYEANDDGRAMSVWKHFYERSAEVSNKIFQETNEQTEDWRRVDSLSRVASWRYHVRLDRVLHDRRLREREAALAREETP